MVYGRGSYTFLNLTHQHGLVGTAGGNAFASFLVGAPFEILRDTFPPGMVELLILPQRILCSGRLKATRRLTVNLGARYDIMPYAREKYNRLSNFDPATGTMLIAGQDTSSRLRNTDYKDIAPRVGLAYALGRDYKTVIRAGYGIGYIDPVGAAGILNSTEFNTPFYYANATVEFPFTAPTYALSSALPKLVVPPASAPSGNERYLVPTDRNQYSETWSLSIQRALSSTLMLEVAYVGTSGVRLLVTSDINAAPPGTTNPTTRQPFGPALSQIEEISKSPAAPATTACNRKFSSGSHMDCRSWLPILGRNRWTTRAMERTDSAAEGQFPQNPLDRAAECGTLQL